MELDLSYLSHQSTFVKKLDLDKVNKDSNSL
jgi:hypothetical protein